MARIRTVKPSFFRHLGLYRAEKETGFPIRVAFEGLWTASDREGRFKWVPEELKLDCLPFDELDFSRVLDALVTRGFIVKYVVDSREYGWIPSFKDHQVINNREAASILPPCNENNSLTREPRVTDATTTPLVQDQVEGKGREGNTEGADAPVKILSFWDVGESFGIQRSTIGRMISDHGEKTVSEAIRDLSLQHKKPANATSYVWGMLKKRGSNDIYRTES